jgi:hypothetical protein
MPETRLAHFDHHWEAELAQGYLEDAGVPSRVASDNLAGGHTYVGSVSGASLFVAREQFEEARGILVAAGVLDNGSGDADTAPGPAHPDRTPPPAVRPLSHLQESDRRDLTERLEAARKAEVRHFIRCMLGVTPTAVIPIVGLALEGNVALLALLCVLVVLVEGWRWIRAGRLVKRIEMELAELAEGVEAGGNGDGAEDEGEGAGAGG